MCITTCLCCYHDHSKLKGAIWKKLEWTHCEDVAVLTLCCRDTDPNPNPNQLSMGLPHTAFSTAVVVLPKNCEHTFWWRYPLTYYLTKFSW